MSKGNSPIKVLRTALSRVQKGWTQNTWVYRDGNKTYVCLEGAMFGYCDQSKHGLTQAQRDARDKVLEVIKDRYPAKFQFWTIPEFNDAPERKQEEVEEVLKLAIIRFETEDGLNDDEVENLLDFKDKAKG